jgi:hypothetical protein
MTLRTEMPERLIVSPQQNRSLLSRHSTTAINNKIITNPIFAYRTVFSRPTRGKYHTIRGINAAPIKLGNDKISDWVAVSTECSEIFGGKMKALRN